MRTSAGRRLLLGPDRRCWEEPILAQLEGIELEDATLAAVVASLGSGPPSGRASQGEIERQIRELALEHGAGRLEYAVFLDRLRALREARESLEVNATGGISAAVAMAWLRALSSTWSEADVPEAKADLLHAIYERIVVTGRTIVSIRLTQAAYAHGLALALPEKVEMARPTGLEPATFGSGTQRSIH